MHADPTIISVHVPSSSHQCEGQGSVVLADLAGRPGVKSRARVMSNVELYVEERIYGIVHSTE